MLFNSFAFVFAFLPISLIGYYLAGRRSHRLAAAWLVLMSFIFYGWWNPLFVILLIGSILCNYVFGLLLQAYERSERLQTAILAVAISANLALLFYYKYVAFSLRILEKFGIHLNFDASGILLPLGISFFTFTQIGYLIDCKTGIAKGRRLLDYSLFVTFFPHLIAGPILHHREMMPQFENPGTYKFKTENLAVGLGIFAIGLAKKVLIADQLAPIANLGFETGNTVGFIPVWAAALAYTLQLYFDFSGYSDMAIGQARMFGIRFPANFNSPYKATSIIGFWQRWHMTLTRYLTLYLYNPVALWVTRRRAASGKSIGAQGAATLPGFVALVAFPTLATMLIAGAWHGAGGTFVVFGLLHGTYLAVNHAWRIFGPGRKLGDAFGLPGWARLLVAGILTHGAVIISLVFFRATSINWAVHMLEAMAGLRGLTFGTFPMADTYTVGRIYDLLLDPLTAVKLVVAYVIVLRGPNILELFSRYDPILGRARTNLPEALQWRPNLAWGACTGILVALSVLYMAGATEFLYFQF